MRPRGGRPAATEPGAGLPQRGARRARPIRRTRRPPRAGPRPRVELGSRELRAIPLAPGWARRRSARGFGRAGVDCRSTSAIQAGAVIHGQSVRQQRGTRRSRQWSGRAVRGPHDAPARPSIHVRPLRAVLPPARRGLERRRTRRRRPLLSLDGDLPAAQRQRRLHRPSDRRLRTDGRADRRLLAMRAGVRGLDQPAAPSAVSARYMPCTTAITMMSATG
jgi:hypothetical protein